MTRNKSFVYSGEYAKVMTPFQIVTRAKMIEEAAKVKMDGLDHILDIEYFKYHFFKHSTVKQWSKPGYEFSCEEARALEIAFSLGW